MEGTTREEIEFEYQVTCYVPWDGARMPTNLSFKLGSGIKVQLLKERGRSDLPRDLRRLYAHATKAESRRADKKLSKFLYELAHGRVPLDLLDGPSRERLSKREPEALTSGRLPEGRVLTDDLFPDFYAQHVQALQAELGSAVERVIDLLALRVAALPVPGELTLRMPAVRIPGSTKWRSLPAWAFSGGSLGGPLATLGKKEAADVQAQLMSPDPPRLGGYSLFREAWQASLGHPRAAFITAFAALETACKEWLGEQLPDTKWLVESMPSPPLAPLVAQYIAPVAERRGFREEAAQLASMEGDLKKYAQRRNELAHGRGGVFNHRETKAALRTLERAYWLLQVAASVPGARENLDRAQARH